MMEQTHKQLLRTAFPPLHLPSTADDSEVERWTEKLKRKYMAFDRKHSAVV